MTRGIIVWLVAALTLPALDAGALQRETRLLTYPPATEAGLDPPEIRIADGTPVSLYFASEVLDERGELHFVTEPSRLGLRVAERTVFLFNTRAAPPGDAGLVTVTLASGRPLTFRVRVVGDGAPADVAVEVVLPGGADEVAPMCLAAVQRVRDELADCRESSDERALQLIAGLFVAASDDDVVSVRTSRRRDKQQRLYVEVIDAVRLYRHTFLRVRLENRDGGGPAWRPGAVQVAVVGPGPRKQALRTLASWSLTAVPAGGSARAVIVVPTPTLPSGASLRLGLHEADGLRHVVLEGLDL